MKFILTLEDMPNGLLSMQTSTEGGVLDQTSGAHQLGWAAFRYIEQHMNQVEASEQGERPDVSTGDVRLDGLDEIGVVSAGQDGERPIPFNPSQALGLRVVMDEDAGTMLGMQSIH